MLTSIFPTLYQNPQYGLLILRVFIGVLFGIRGVSSVRERWNEKYLLFVEMRFPFPRFFTWLIALVEILGGAFLILGFYFQITCFVLGVIVLVAAVVKLVQHDLLSESQMVYNILFVVLLALMFLGPGINAIELPL